MTTNEYFYNAKKYEFSIEKCPVCGGRLYNVYGKNFITCCDCDNIFVKKFVLDDVSFIPIQTKSFGYDVKIEPKYSDISESGISLYLDVKPQENKEDEENEKITNNISEFGFCSKNFPPKYTPIKIANTWCIFGENIGVCVYKDCGEKHIKLLYYDKGFWFVCPPWYDGYELEELERISSFANNLLKEGKLE